MKLTGNPSAWDDPAAAEIGAIVAGYNRGLPRSDLASVRSLLREFAPSQPRHHVVVVGTNGKTSAATFLAQLLAGNGTRVGLYTSPHLARWSERVRIDGAEVDDDELISTLVRVDRVAAEIRPVSPDLRFFDLLTLAAEDIFGRAGVEVAIFEAGIGGRLDATRALEPELVMLTSIGDDHRGRLGSTPEQILAEKLAVTPPGASLVIGALPFSLSAQARAWAARERVRLLRVAELEVAAGQLPRFQRRNLAVAQTAAKLAGVLFSLGASEPAGPPEAHTWPPKTSLTAPGQLTDLDVRGRFERGEIDGVRYVADVGHNPAAWEELLAELPRAFPGRRWVAVVGLTVEREAEELADALAGAPAIAHVVATVTPVRTPRDPAQIVAALAGGVTEPSAEVCETPAAAFELAASFAHRSDLDLLVTGSSFLISEFLAWLATRTKS